MVYAITLTAFNFQYVINLEVTTFIYILPSIWTHFWRWKCFAILIKKCTQCAIWSSANLKVRIRKYRCDSKHYLVGIVFKLYTIVPNLYRGVNLQSTNYFFLWSFQFCVEIDRNLRCLHGRCYCRFYQQIQNDMCQKCIFRTNRQMLSRQCS